MVYLNIRYNMSWKIDRLKSYVVYGILNTETGQYIYIGSTRRRLWDRANSHSTGHGNDKLNDFLNLQKANKKKPVFQIIHECDIIGEENIDLDYWEHFYIKKYKEDGHPLANIMIRDIPFPIKPDIIGILKQGKYNNAWVAHRLYKDTPRKTAISKFRNKLQNIDGRCFTSKELKEIENILK